MELSSILKIFLFFFMSGFLQEFANTHSLQCLYTGITPGINLPEFTAVGLVDGEQVVYYDSNTRKTILKTEWLKKLNSYYPYYWNGQTQQMLSHQEDLKTLLATVILLYNRPKEVHTLQWMYGCELDDDGTTRGYMQYGYDGEDFVGLDLRTETWTAARYHHVISTDNWVSTAGHATYWKSYLEYDCIDQLKLFVSFGKETLERKVRPEGSVFHRHSSPSPEVVCHATGFFPKPINITWQKDGEDVHEDVELRETLPNQDGSFQKRIILKVPAEELQNYTYTCMVQHSSLEKELVLSVLEQKDTKTLDVFVLVAVFGAMIVIFLSVLIFKHQKRHRGIEAEDNEFSEKMLKKVYDELEYSYVVYSPVSNAAVSL